MVILLGGISCTGKTLMSQRLLEKYKIPYFSIDNLKMGLFRSNSNCGFTPEDSNEAIAAKLWPITKEMVKTVIENNQNIIIEGCYILPELVNDFEEEYASQIVSVFIGFSTAYIEKNFISNIIKNRGVIEKRDTPEDRPIAQFIREHKELRDKCIENGAKYFEIDSDYEAEIKKAYDFIDSRIVKLNRENNN